MLIRVIVSSAPKGARKKYRTLKNETTTIQESALPTGISATTIMTKEEANKKIGVGMTIAIVFLSIVFLVVLIGMFNTYQGNDRIHHMTYRVYYNQNTVREYSITNDGPIYVGSDRGSNFIKKYSITGPTIITTSAPIEVVSYTREPESE